MEQGPCGQDTSKHGLRRSIEVANTIGTTEMTPVRTTRSIDTAISARKASDDCWPVKPSLVSKHGCDCRMNMDSFQLPVAVLGVEADIIVRSRRSHRSGPILSPSLLEHWSGPLSHLLPQTGRTHSAEPSPKPNGSREHLPASVARGQTTTFYPHWPTAKTLGAA